MMPKHYILDASKQPVVCEDMLSWAVWMSTTDRTVAFNAIENAGEKFEISTVFIGIDYGFGRGSLKVFETMVFGSSDNDTLVRYSSWEDALVGHSKIMANIAVLIAQSRKLSLKKIRECYFSSIEE